MNDREFTMAVVDAAETFIDTNPKALTERQQMAFDELVVRINNLREYQTTSHEGESVPARTRPCERCGVPIFFALAPPARWMPLEIDRIPAKDVAAGHRWIVDFYPETKEPTVRFDPNAQGQVFVDHRQTCGVGPGPKVRSVGLLRRWKVNMELADKETDVFLAELLALAHEDSETGPTGADDDPTKESHEPQRRRVEHDDGRGPRRRD